MTGWATRFQRSKRQIDQGSWGRDVFKRVTKSAAPNKTVRFMHFSGGYLGATNPDQLIVCCIGTVLPQSALLDPDRGSGPFRLYFGTIPIDHFRKIKYMGKKNDLREQKKLLSY
jgi:hypothetical protein